VIAGLYRISEGKDIRIGVTIYSKHFKAMLGLMYGRCLLLLQRFSQSSRADKLFPSKPSTIWKTPKSNWKQFMKLEQKKANRSTRYKPPQTLLEYTQAEALSQRLARLAPSCSLPTEA
jgi:hypothetical protein